MIKNFLKILILIFTLFLLFIGYFAYFGITTSKFNSIIRDQIKKQNSNFDIDLKKVKLHLDLKNISIKIKTKDPEIILNNSDNIKLKPKVKEFYKYFKYNNKILDIDDFTPKYLEIYSKNILKKIKENKGGWENKVPAGISEMIIKKKMFGYK